MEKIIFLFWTRIPMGIILCFIYFLSSNRHILEYILSDLCKTLESEALVYLPIKVSINLLEHLRCAGLNKLKFSWRPRVVASVMSGT